MTAQFERDFTLQQRLNESNKVMSKYPDKIPVIIEKVSSSKSSTELGKNKFLVSRDTTCGKFIYTLRKKLSMKPEEGLYIYINGEIPPSNQLMGDIYEKFKQTDGFLYMFFSLESTFGSE